MLSPIPEIAGSQYVSPDISPEPIMDPISKSAKILSPANKITKIKKIDRKEINIRVQKKLAKAKSKKKADGAIQIQDIDSYAIYLKHKQEFRKIIPENQEKNVEKAIFLSKSPERSDNTHFVRRKSVRKHTLPKMVKELKSPTEKASELLMRCTEITNSHAKLKQESKKISEIIEKYNNKRSQVNTKLSKIADLASEEIRGITKSMLYKQH